MKLKRRNDAPPKRKSKQRVPRPIARSRKASPANLSQDGISFLKCAFAAPDFLDDAGAGLPLGGDQKLLLKKHRLESTVSLTANRSQHYLFLATPGQAYWTCETSVGGVPGGTTSWTPVSFADSFTASGLFTNAASSRAENVNAFRYAALSAELKSSAPLQTATGTIIVSKPTVTQSLAYKTANFATFDDAAGTNPVLVKATYAAGPPVLITTSFVDSATTPKTLTMSSVLHQYSSPVVNGLEATAVQPSKAYSGHLNDGAFAVALRSEDHDFTPIMENCAKLQDANMHGVLNGDFLGLDNAMQAIYVRVDNPSTSAFNARMRVWACVEYKPVLSSALYEYARFPPQRDEVALALYARYAKELPIAVIAAMNDSAWQRAWSWIKAALGAVSFIPGPVGMVAGAAAGLASAIDALRV